MADETFEPDVLRVFGGLCTVVARGQLGKGMSPACNDVEFFPAVVQSRPGYALRYTTPTAVRGAATFIDRDSKRYTLVLQGDGTLSYDGLGQNLIPTLNPITTGIAANASMKGRNAFGRYIAAFSDGQRPIDFPISWNLQTGYRGLSTTAPTYPMTGGDTAALGQVTQGIHYLGLSFEDDRGYVSRVGPLQQMFSALGSRKISLSNIQLGPPGTIRRRIWATVRLQGDLYSLGSQNGFTIEDNTTTTATIDFSDTDLISNGIPYSSLLTLVEPRMAVGVSQYANRLVLWGVYDTFDSRAITYQILPTTSGATLLGPADADFDTVSPHLGITVSPWTALAAGGASTNLYPAAGTRGQFFLIAGNGSDPAGDFVQLFAQKQESPLQETQFFLPPGTHVGLVVRLKGSPTLDSGGIRFRVQGNDTNKLYLDRIVYGYDLKPYWQTFVLSGFDFGGGTAAIDPKDQLLSIRIAGSGSNNGTNPIAAGEWVAIDFYRFVDARYPFDGDKVWYSSSIQQPGEFDLVTSPLEVAAGNGEEITGVFEQSGNEYILKQRSMWVTSDNGNDPSAWNVDNVSPVVGSPSMNGWDVGPDFAIVCDLSGVYRFTGGAPEKISDEIENRWQGDLDTSRAHLMWCAIDPNKKIIRIGIPTRWATWSDRELSPCQEIFTLNYVEGWESGVASAGVGRKWSVETVFSTGGAVLQMSALERRFNLFGQRRSGNGSVGAWGADGSTSPVTMGAGSVLDALGGSSAIRCSWGYGGTHRIRQAGVAIGSGGSYVVSLWVRKTTYSGLITVRTNLPGVADQTFEPTTTWTRYVFHFGPAAAAGGTTDVWLEFTSPSGDIDIFGVQTQIGLYDKGYWTSTSSVLGASGFVSVPGEAPDFNPRLTDDWDSIMNPLYTTWAFQTDIGRSLYDKLVLRIEGAGNIIAGWLQPDNIVKLLPGSSDPNAAQLVTPARYDLELGDNHEDINAAVQISTNARGAWWSLTRLAVLLKAAPYSTLRR